MSRKDAWPGAMRQPRPRSGICRMCRHDCEPGFGPHGFECLSSVATALVAGCRFYGGGRLRVQRDGRNPIFCIRRKDECLEARPRKGRAWIATPRRVQLCVRDDMFQVGVFGPAIAHDLRGGFDLPIGKSIAACLTVDYLDPERPVVGLVAPSLMFGCEQEFLTCQAALASGAQAQTSSPCCGSSSSGSNQ